jgi:sporulation integral membrane protein YtvI
MIFVSLLLLVSFLFIKFILPLIWPFAVGFILAIMIKPVVVFLKKYFHINKMLGTALVILAVTGMIVILSGWLVRGIFAQVSTLMENMNIYMEKADDYLCGICRSVGDAVGMEGDSLFNTVSRNLDNFMGDMETKITSIIMGTSIPAIVAVIEFIIGIVLVIVSLFLFIKDTDEIKDYLENCFFRREIRFVFSRTLRTLKAYIKAQFIIMAAVAAECVAGFMILGNRYALLLGAVVGVLDALPLLGVGTVLIPWTIVYVAAGNFIKAAAMFTIFIVCYFTRELMEPKLIGDKIGVHPVMTLISIYAGFKLLGFTGMFLAPLVYILIKDATAVFIEFIKT